MTAARDPVDTTPDVAVDARKWLAEREASGAPFAVIDGLSVDAVVMALLARLAAAERDRDAYERAASYACENACGKCGPCRMADDDNAEDEDE